MTILKSRTEANATRTNAYKRLNMPQPAEVRSDPSGRPLAVRKGGEWLRVKDLADRWRIDDRWWTDAPVVRMYCAVILEDGMPLTIFRDMVADVWYERLCPITRV